MKSKLIAAALLIGFSIIDLGWYVIQGIRYQGFWTL